MTANRILLHGRIAYKSFKTWEIKVLGKICSPSKVHRIMRSMFSSMSYCTLRLQIICRQIAREQIGDDVKKRLQHLRQMQVDDLGFQFSVDLDNKASIKKIYFGASNGRSQ
ncbi:hypothetical protein C2845_PM12G29300 [Panicum miliaceum]|uniref:Uncharacterized protein n=1 Tax=Panicum miliaceum TaxID=4540 RepID=A0A3L6QN04_PANMI|nr:hypothetical protein C2845_PM12G29300 [Panicum miliaceum]